MQVHDAGKGDVCVDGDDYTCPIGCSKTDDARTPFCVWEGKTECHNTPSMSAYPDAVGEWNKQSKAAAAARCNEVGAHLCTKAETNQHWTSFMAAREDVNFYGWVADGDGCIVNGLQSTDAAPKHACGYIETTTYNAMCCRDTKPIKQELEEAVTSVSVGRVSIPCVQ